MKNNLLTPILWIILSFPIALAAQDVDGDGLNDQLEANLAARFAPEWRFHKSTGTGSNQNEDEVHFPSSIEWFHDYVVQQTGNPPNLQYIPTGAKAPITDISNLAAMMVPGTGTSAGDPSWGDCNNSSIRITDYPEKIPGDPNGFPTYYHCYPLGDGKVAIGYLLFYSMDYKGRYWAFGWIEKGKHRGDWEGINVVVSNVDDLSSPAPAQNAVLETVKFSGHGTAKYIDAASSRIRLLHDTHPKVYISFGSHTPYPEPGSFNDYKIDWGWGFANWYDDYFYGNGLVAQRWHRPLINVGETGSPRVGWLNYKGWWGPDDNGENSSPPSPPCKGPWTAGLDGFVSWEEAIIPAVSSQYWEDGFYLDCSPELAMSYSPDPGYNCAAIVDCRVTCPADMQFPVGTVAAGVNLIAPGGVLGILPCHYPEILTITKPMTLRAPEGPAVIGAQ